LGKCFDIEQSHPLWLTIPKIFRARFHRNGSVNKSYKEIAEEFNLDMVNANQFISGIVTSMIRCMNAYSKGSKWNK
jgi:hypothetical protein